VKDEVAFLRMQIAGNPLWNEQEKQEQQQIIETIKGKRKKDAKENR
jgi:hypothetical protein